MGRRGRKRRLDVESECWLLVGSGVGTVEACKQLGIGRKTGYRWRAENGGLPPAALGEGVRSQRYLSLLERQRIATLRRDGLGVRRIAEELGRSPSTISRELRRNTAPSWSWSGAPSRSPRGCAPRSRSGRTGTCATRPSTRPFTSVAGAGCTASSPAGFVPAGRCASGAVGPRSGRPGSSLPAGSSTSDRRSCCVENASETGRAISSSAATTAPPSPSLVDRHSRYLQLVALPDGQHAASVRDALIAALAQLPAAARRTLTWDQGSELAHHEHIGEHLQHGVFFAYPASPWLRGTNENTNGLLRQYFPKGTDLSIHEPEDLRRVQDRLNDRPRKTLDWRTPAEVFTCAVRSS
jgi:transposase, IS30 family